MARDARRINKVKHFFFHLALLIAAGFVAASVVPAVHAQGVSQMVASVPFDFQVAGKTVPAGEYALSLGAVGRIDLRTPDRHTLFLMTNPGDMVSGNKSKLVFHRYGKKYFLRSVVSRNQPFSLELPESKEEKDVANVAGLRPVVETVYAGGMR
jgi:hypothetical protein